LIESKINGTINLVHDNRKFAKRDICGLS